MSSNTVHADLLNPEYRAWSIFLRRSNNWDRNQIEAHQLAELRRVTRLAYENTRGYRSLYDAAGVQPRDISTLADITKLPFVDKETIRNALEDFSIPGSHRTYVTTGGSTGIPFGFYRDNVAFQRELASKAHQYYRVGWCEGDRQLVLRGQLINTNDHMQYVPQFNELRCSSYHLTYEVMETYYRRALDYKPEWIRCYPSSGYIFAEFLQDTGRRLPPLKGVLSASENLYDFQQGLMTRVFNSRVFSHYGHYELTVLAGFCEYSDVYHVLPQYGLAELIDTKGRQVTEPGCTGEIVGTSFILTQTPFVRYRTGDLATLSGWTCEWCGRPYQIWERVEGRLQEFVLTRTGRMISMTAINMHDDTFDHVRRFQFHQRVPGKVIFRYIPTPRCDALAQAAMRAKLSAKLGDDLELEVEAVPDIPLTNRGKHRFLVQELRLKYGDR
jgi:phenylacetate-CoA ligase